METTAGQPVYSAPFSGVLRAGGHVHQLLNLVHALAGNPTDGAGSGAVVPGSLGMDVGSLTDAECVGWAQDVEALLRVGQALAVQVAGELGRRVSAGRFAETGSRGQVGLLVDALQLSAAEASRRLKLAAVVLPVVEGISGAVAPAAHPVLGEAFLSGAVSQERASMVARYVQDADRLAAEGRITEETRVLVEESLVGTARVQGPDFVRTVGNQILSHLDPDGHKPSHAELLAKQGLFFHRPRNGLISFHGAVTILQHEELMAALDLFGNPNKHKNVDTITGDKDNPDRSGEYCGGADPAGSGGAAGSGASECEGQSSLLDGLGGLAGLFTSTGEGAMAQPGPEPAPGQESGRPGWSEPPERVGSAASEESADPPTAPEEPDPPEPPDDPDMPESSVPPERPMPPVAAEPSGARNDPDGPEQPEQPQSPQQPDRPDQPEPRVAAGGTPAGLAAGRGVDGGVGWWGRRLEPWEIPARPPEAPEYATPPVYAGQDWFWLPAEPATGGWATPSNNDSNSDFFNIFEDPPLQRPVSYRDETFNIWQDRTAPTALTAADVPPAAAADADGDTGIAARARAGAGAAEDTSGQWGAGWATGNDDSDARGIADAADASDARVEQALSGLDSMDPASTDPAVKDTRTRAQQLLDGLVSCVKLASRTGKLPRNGGLPAQLILACSQTQLEQAYTGTGTGAGTINTTFNGPTPLRLFDAALCDPQITRIVYGTGQEILNAGRTQRLFLPAQRRILYARDLGCSFPECTIPATWTEAHHIIPWQEGGETSIENGCLLCDHHHSLIHSSDWTVQLINGTPWFTPPWLIDRTQTPRRNTYHHGLTPHQRP